MNPCKDDGNNTCTIKNENNYKIQASIPKDILIDELEIPFADKIIFMKTVLKSNFQATSNSLDNTMPIFTERYKQEQLVILSLFVNFCLLSIILQDGLFEIYD